MKIEVDIEGQLEDIWNQIGLSSDLQEKEYQILDQKVQTLFGAFLQETYQKFQKLKSEVEEAESKVAELLVQFELGTAASIDRTPPLLVRQSNAQKLLNQLDEATRDRKEEYELTFDELSRCYDLLEIADRREFSEKGKIYSIERLNKMKNLIGSLHSDLKSRQDSINDLVISLSSLHINLGLPKFEYPSTFGEKTIENLRNIEQSLSTHLQQNQKQSEEISKEISRLEKVLSKKTSEKPSIFSDACLQSLNSRLQSLIAEKELHISDFIEASKKDLLSLWGQLHIPIPSQSEFPFFHSESVSKRTLIALETEVARLSKLKDSLEPLLDLIAQREEIISANQELSASALDSSRLTSRRGMRASVLIQEERARKRYITELPKINAKMVGYLEEYEDTYGEPFLWDGENLLETIKGQIKEVSASISQSKAKVKRSDRSTTALSQRAPFQLQSFMI